MSIKNPSIEAIDELDDKDWEELRGLFVGSEKVDVEKLAEFLENPDIMVNKIAKVLPEAVRLISEKSQDLTASLVNAFQPIIEKAIQQSALSDPDSLSEGMHMILPSSINMGRERSRELTESLAESLTPLIEQAVKNSSQLDIKPLSEGLYPIIGPAIRKAVSAAFRQINQTLNSNLNRTLSVSAVKWRVQALSTGKPFLDIVAQNTFTYQVTQVFLIHKETGLLLLDVEAPNIASRDADMVSAMLKAIQDFVQDSFSVEKNEELSTIEVGENTIWIEQGPRAILAGVIFGNAPLSIRDRFIKALEKIHIDFSEALAEFDGDTMVFEANPQYLKYCFQEQLKEENTGTSKSKWFILAILVGIGSFFGVDRYLDSKRWSDYVAKLETQPGIIVLKEGRSDGRFFVKGLRTPGSFNPEGLFNDFKLKPEEVVSDWKIIRMLDTEDVLSRAVRILKPPATVKLSLQGSILVIGGSAERQWIEDAEKSGEEIGGLSGLDKTRLKVTDSIRTGILKKIEALKKEIEGAVFYFPIASTALTAEQTDSVLNISGKLQSLISHCKLVQKKVVIHVRGYADSGGKKDLNQRFGEQRAQAVYNILLGEGISKDLIETQAFIEEKGIESSDLQSKRRATITIDILD